VAGANADKGGHPPETVIPRLSWRRQTTEAHEPRWDCTCRCNARLAHCAPSFRGCSASSWWNQGVWSSSCGRHWDELWMRWTPDTRVFRRFRVTVSAIGRTCDEWAEGELNSRHQDFQAVSSDSQKAA